MDGVLADSEHWHVKVENEILKESGVELTEKDFERYKGVTENFFWNDLIKRHNITTTYFDLVKKKRDLFLNIADGIESFEGVRELLSTLKSKGFQMAVASSSDGLIVDYILMRLGIKDCFDKIVSGDQVVNGKPAPDIFIKAAERMNLKPSDCLVVEDSINGILAAKAAGMRCVAVTNSFPGNKLSNADLVVDSLKNLDLEILKKL